MIRHSVLTADLMAALRAEERRPSAWMRVPTSSRVRWFDDNLYADLSEVYGKELGKSLQHAKEVGGCWIRAHP
jgi:hypothetical protein